MKAIEPIDDRYDICIHPSREGWYVHDAKTGRVSKLYASKQNALRAFRDGTIKWKD